MILRMDTIDSSVRSEECRVAGAYLYSVLMTFSCFTSKNACFGDFSFDSHCAMISNNHKSFSSISAVHI
jgi:hypothetical protein